MECCSTEKIQMWGRSTKNESGRLHRFFIRLEHQMCQLWEWLCIAAELFPIPGWNKEADLTHAVAVLESRNDVI